MRKKQIFKLEDGFTLIEIVVVLTILVIAAVLALPMLGSAADMQLRSAANIIAADIEYAKSLAITRQENFSVVFNAASDSYEVQDQNATVIDNPRRPGHPLEVVFPSDKRVSRVDITSADFDPDSSQTITFDYLGSPYSGTISPLTSGQITLQSDTLVMTVSVEPVTGYVTIMSP
jgi:prepilin-type N-terminal cleavage/methylation domain-containing protein